MVWVLDGEAIVEGQIHHERYIAVVNTGTAAADRQEHWASKEEGIAIYRKEYDESGNSEVAVFVSVKKDKSYCVK